MSGREKARPGGQWYGTTAPGPRQVCAIDQRVSELINIDGGTWNPTKPIVFGGAGLKLNAIGGLTGGVTTKQGYGTSDPRIELPASTWPAFSTPSTRTRSAMLAPGTFGGSGGSIVYFDNAGYPNEVEAGGFISGVLYASQSRLHTGATLDKATFYYRITSAKPGALPGTPEVINVARVSSTNTTQVLHTTSTSSGIAYTGIGAARDALTLNTWYNNGETIAFEYVPDQFNTIDTSAYSYLFSLYVGKQAEFYGIKLDFTVPDRRYE
jgi:hypothetical protein